MATFEKLSTLDIIIIVGYFILVIGIGLYASCRSARGTVSGYFLAGRNMNWFMVGSSIFVSNIGAEHILGLAGSGAAGGIGVGAWETVAVCTIQLLGYLFMPVYLSSQVRTTPEYLAKRFGGNRLRIYYTLVSLVLSILTKCSVGLFTGAVVVQQAIGGNLYLAVAGLILVVAILTITGGLTAVIYTDAFQCILMVSGAIAISVIGYKEVGGFDGLWRQYPLAIPNITSVNCTGQVHPEWDHMLRSLSDPDFPWLGFLMGGLPTFIWYFCVDQVMAQRTLASRSVSHGQVGTQFTAILKILPLYLMVFPGMISRILYTDEVACVDPDKCFEVCQNRLGCSNIAFPKLVLELLPSGLRGLMVSVMIAALMSGLDSMFNSTSAIFVVDIWTRARKQASIREQMVVGRLFMIVMAGLAMAWVPVLQGMNSGQIFLYLAETINYLAPGVSGIYLISTLWPRATEKAAFFSMFGSQILGITRMIMAWTFKPPPPCSGLPDTRPSFLKDMPYLYFSGILFYGSMISCVVISLFTAPLNYKYICRTTFWTRYDKYSEDDIKEGNVKVTWTKWGFVRTEYVGKNKETLALTATNSSENVDKGKEETLMTKVTLMNDLDTQPLPQTRKKTCRELVVSWLCGVSNLQGELSSKEAEEQRARDMKACSLEQTPTQKLLLGLLALVVAATGIFQMIFWSVWTYIPSP